MLADNPSPARWSVAVVAVMAAFGQLLTWMAGTVTGMNWGIHPSAWWHTAGFLLSIVTPAQCIALIAWSATTGALLAGGTWGRAWPMRWRNARLPFLVCAACAAFVAGALVPMGFTLLAGSLGHVWPNTEGPFDAPVMTLLLVAYSLLIPWLLGRLITRSARPRAQRPAGLRVARPSLESKDPP
jgi:hypothetical protein